MNVDYFIKQQVSDFRTITTWELPEEELYKNIEDIQVRFIFAALHSHLNSLLSFYNHKAAMNGHFNADQSRDLMDMLKRLKETTNALLTTEYAFEIHPEYKKTIDFIQPHLSFSGGSPIPDDYEELFILEYEPIFTLNTDKKIQITSNKSVEKKLVDVGSYATVSKYKDPFTNITIAVKTAKPTLTEFELERFKKEYELMKSFDSPYIAKVYKYSDEKDEFYMEFIPFTLQKFITKRNNTLTLRDRKRIINQIYSGLRYIHSKGIFHRDISLKNIMLNEHDDGSIIVKLLDFGYLKDTESTLTREETLFQGSLNDPELKRIGFSKYGLQHEIYALTQVIFYVMTGRENLSRTKNTTQDDFLLYGMNGDLKKRAQTLDELYKKFSSTDWE